MKTEKRQPDYFKVSILMNVCYEQLEKTDDCFEREGDGGEGGKLWEAKDWALPKAGMKERIEQVQCLPFKNFLAEAIAHQKKIMHHL